MGSPIQSFLAVLGTVASKWLPMHPAEPGRDQWVYLTSVPVVFFLPVQMRKVFCWVLQPDVGVGISGGGLHQYCPTPRLVLLSLTLSLPCNAYPNLKNGITTWQCYYPRQPQVHLPALKPRTECSLSSGCQKCVLQYIYDT